MLVLTITTTSGEQVPFAVSALSVFLKGPECEGDEKRVQPAEGAENGADPVEITVRVMKPTTIIRLVCGTELLCWGPPQEVAGILLSAVQPKQVIASPGGLRRIQ